jgi:hypothetical protein
MSQEILVEETHLTDYGSVKAITNVISFVYAHAYRLYKGETFCFVHVELLCYLFTFFARYLFR